MTNSYNPSTQERNMGLFRSGQDFDYDDLEYLADRELVTFYLIYTLVNKAIGKGFKLKHEEEDHPQDKAIQDAIKPIYGDFTNGASKERLFGSMVYEYQTQKQAEKDQIFFNTFDPRDFTIELDEFDNITLLKLEEKIEFFDSSQTLEERPITTFDDVLYRWRKGKRERNKGTSYIESIYDILVGIQNLDESCVYFVIRVGAGLKVVYVPKDKLQDTEYMAELRQNIQEMNATNTTMIIGTDPGETKTEVQLLTNQPIDFNQLLQFYFKLISLRTTVPVTILEGITPGQLEGGKINEALLFDVLSEIQADFEALLRWLIDKIAFTLTLDLGDYDIEWVTREAIDEVGIQDLLTKQLDNLKKLLDIGFDLDKATPLVKLELTKVDLDPEVMAQKQAMRENLMNNGPSDEDDEQSTGSEEDEEETTEKDQ